MSRGKTIDPKDLEIALDHARRQNFDTERLQYTPDGPDPSGTPAPAARYGCSAFGVGATRGRVGFFGAVDAGLGLLALLRRRRAKPLPAS